MSNNTLHKFFDEINKNFLFEKNPRLAIAVSGGSDSVSLAVLLAKWAKINNAKIICLTVNHNLRQEAIEEAKYVADLANSLGLGHQILSCNIEGKANLQAKARDARIELLTDYCQKHEIKHLFMAHHLDDVVETFFIRLFRGSGLQGLSAVQKINLINGVRIIRPLLGFKKEELRQLLRMENIAWMEDKSNDNDLYLRNKVRKMISSDVINSIIEPYLLVNRCSMAISSIKVANELFMKECSKHMVRSVKIYQEGYLTIDIAKLKTLEHEVFLNIVSASLVTISGKHYYRPRLQSLQKTLNKLLDNVQTKVTLWGCVLLKKGGIIYVCKEMVSQPETKFIDENTVFWDNRFVISYSNFKENVALIPVVTRKMLRRYNTKKLPMIIWQTVPALKVNDDIYIHGTTEKGIKGLNIRFKPMISLAKNDFQR